MTTWKSDAVKSGVRPDHLKAGRLNARTGRFVTSATNNPVSGDTIQLVPVPKGAKIIDVIATTGGLATASCKISIGDGGSTARYLASASWQNAKTVNYKNTAAAGAPAKTYSADDTIDATIASANPSTSSKYLEVTVLYVMEGTVDDEDTDSSSMIP